MPPPKSGVDMEQYGDVPTKPRFIHFKCRIDHGWDEKGIADSFFLPDQKILVVLEPGKVNKNHIHFQGYTLDPPRTVTEKLSELAKRHCLRDPTSFYYGGPKCRPVSQISRAATVTGFQFMNEWPLSTHNPRYSNLFTQEELAELKDTRNANVDKKKTRIRDLLAEKMTATDFSGDAKSILMKAARYVNEMLQTDRARSSKHTRFDIFNGLTEHPMCTDQLWKDLWMEWGMEDFGNEELITYDG